jgi:hypothetical protein
MDMQIDLFAQQAYGRAALKKMGAVPENFRLYVAGWLGAPLEKADTMKVTGCEFRVAKKGPNAGKLCMMVPGTGRTVYVNRTEIMAEVEASEAVPACG